MYKKVFILILVICICGLGIFLYKTYKQNNKTIANNEIEQNEILEEKDLVNVPKLEEIIQEEPVEEKNNEMKTESIIEDKKETKVEPIIENKKTPVKEENVIKDNNRKDTNDSIEQPIEEKEVVVNKEEDSKQEVTNEDEKNEVEVEKVDLEYKNLLKQVEYSTYDECMDIGFEKALEDTINILGFSCPYIAYKGKVIGYRLQLNYTNPMEN